MEQQYALLEENLSRKIELLEHENGTIKEKHMYIVQSSGKNLDEQKFGYISEIASLKEQHAIAISVCTLILLP